MDIVQTFAGPFPSRKAWMFLSELLGSILFHLAIISNIVKVPLIPPYYGVDTLHDHPCLDNAQSVALLPILRSGYRSPTFIFVRRSVCLLVGWSVCPSVHP